MPRQAAKTIRMGEGRVLDPSRTILIQLAAGLLSSMQKQVAKATKINNIFVAGGEGKFLSLSPASQGIASVW